VDKRNKKKELFSLNTSIDTKQITQSKTNLMTKDNSVSSLKKTEKSSVFASKKKRSIDLKGENSSGHGSVSRGQINNVGNLTSRKPHCFAQNNNHHSNHRSVPKTSLKFPHYQ
jgi:hypothetical protein